MTHFPDGAPYGYALHEPGSGNLVCAGWLESGQRFPTGVPPQGFLDRLAWLCVHSRDRSMRGFHVCDICTDEEASWTAVSGVRVRDPAYVLYAGEKRLLGWFEITVDAGDRVYAAPSLILHYVAKHNYLPPEDFVAAVMLLEEDRCLRDWSLHLGADYINFGKCLTGTSLARRGGTLPGDE